ncbi:hypothetical protein PHYSODRAFT_380440, partial [Phytophthora sojae]
DSARPGGPTTMDVLMAWIIKPENAKRWRSESRAPLIREMLAVMHGEGLVHRNPQFVRAKLTTLEKKFVAAKDWLQEAGVHDAYMRDKATPEVRAHVERMCPLFRKLDPAFHGARKNAETVEREDNDSTEDAESAEEERKKERKKQRLDVYELERSKLQCEVEAKQVQLLLEKAAARKKLDQLGVPKEEIDRLLPL